MWSETMLKSCVKAKLDFVFGQPVVLLDDDTYNTPVGRPDAVLLTKSKQLVVVEFERVLDSGNIEHALIDQAWACARYWYMTPRHDDILRMYEYCWKYRFPNVREIPDIRRELGLKANEAVWDRKRPTIVIAGAWEVSPAAYEKAEALMKRIMPSERHKMPCEVWIYEVNGKGLSESSVAIQDCQRTLVFQYEKGDVLPEGPGLRSTIQHLPTSLSDESRQMAELLPDFLPYELKKDSDLFSKSRWKKQIVNFSPWGTETGIMFSFSRMDSENPIKGPHYELYVCQQRELGAHLRDHLLAHLSEVARELGCPKKDLAWQGYAYPIKQHRVDDSSPAAIAEGFGNFISVIYRHVNDIVRQTLDAR